MSGFFILNKMFFIFNFLRCNREDIFTLIVADDIAGQATKSYVNMLVANPIKVNVIPFHH